MGTVVGVCGAGVAGAAGGAALGRLSQRMVGDELEMYSAKVMQRAGMGALVGVAGWEMGTRFKQGITATDADDSGATDADATGE